MKHVALLIGSCLASLHSEAQVSGFTSSTARWYVSETSSANVQAFLETWTIIYGTTGDTMISGISWQHVASSPDPMLSVNLTDQGLLRQDGEVVVYMAPGAAPDTLYDFGMAVGDSARYLFDGFPDYLHLLSIDTVVIAGNQHRRFIFADYGGGFCILDGEQWIQGLGSTRGPLFPLFAKEFCEEFNESMNLVCFEESGALYWSAPGQTNCVVNITLGMDKPGQEEEPLQLWPNPGCEQLHVAWARTGASTVLLRDLQGRTVLVDRLNGRIGHFDASSLSVGMYTLQVIGSDGLQATAKWIKQ